MSTATNLSPDCERESVSSSGAWKSDWENEAGAAHSGSAATKKLRAIRSIIGWVWEYGYRRLKSGWVTSGKELVTECRAPCAASFRRKNCAPRARSPRVLQPADPFVVATFRSRYVRNRTAARPDAPAPPSSTGPGHVERDERAQCGMECASDPKNEGPHRPRPMGSLALRASAGCGLATCPRARSRGGWRRRRRAGRRGCRGCRRTPSGP